MASNKPSINRLQLAFFSIVVLAGMALFTAFANFNALHEQFLGANFDSVHGARTLLKAQFFLRQAAEKLEGSRIAGPASRGLVKQAAEALSLAANYSAEGRSGSYEVRADLIAGVQSLEADLAQLAGADPGAITDDRLRPLIGAVNSLADAFGVAELEDWGRLSSINSELTGRMGQLRLFIAIMGGIFLVIMAVLVRSVVRTSRAEAELKEAKAETEAIQQTTLDASTMGIIYVDSSPQSDRPIVAANRQMAVIFGYPAEELLGLHLGRLYADSEGYHRTLANFDILLASGGVIRDEFQMQRKDGSHFWCAISGKAVEPSNPARGVVCTVEDISEFKEAIAELENARYQAEAANRAKTEFLANMSHEIRTPFTAVLGMLELLLRTRLDAQQQQHAELAYRSTKQLLTIVDDILDLSKIEMGKLRIEASATDLRSLLEGIVEVHGVAAGEKTLELSLVFDPDLPPWVMADPVRLRQIIDNLTGNALKFTAQGKVEIQAKRLASEGEGCRLRFSVADTGIGIAPQLKQRIFDKFTQADTSTARIYGGSGLGLAICKELVAAMGGVMGVDSVQGQGSCFWFEVELPVAAAPLAGQGAKPGAPVVRLDGIRILLVDDNETSRKVVGEFLRDLGATVIEAGDGEVAVTLAREMGPDVILMDGQMPVCDGYEATRRIRAGDSSARRVPIIALTAHAMEADREKCLGAGMDDYLTKPISSERLAERIAMHLGRPAAPAGGEASPADGEVYARVLVAEDDSAIQLACRVLLQRLGCRVEVAGNGQEALELGEKLDFDLVFLDCRMPILNGWETARRWRERERVRMCAPTALIAMTAGQYYGEQDDCFAAGMNDVLLKPFTEEALRLLLEEWLGPRREAESTVQ